MIHHLHFLILGAQKSGTTSLRLYLQHYANYFFLPSSELHFWNKDVKYQSGQGIQDYLENFQGAKEGQMVGEKCPSYLASEDAPERIHKYYPDIKLVTILRNPADRAYSAYWHGRRVGAIPTDRSFSEAIRNYESLNGIAYGDVVSRGFYQDQIEHWRKTYKPEQMHFLKFEETTEASQESLKSALNFLLDDPLAATKVGEYEFPKVNIARTSKHPRIAERIHRNRHISYERKQRWISKMLQESEIPAMSDIDRAFLDDLYAEKNSRLPELIGENFRWSN